MNKKILTMLIITGFLTSSLTAVNITVKKINGNMVHEENNEAKAINVKPDGSISIQNAEGSTIEKWSDGSKIIKTPDGSTIEVRPDGSKLIKKSDGSTVEVKGEK